jgi:hypothetical protein
MGMLDDLLAQASGNVDLNALAAQVGLDPAQVQGALGQLLPQMADPAVNNAQALGDVAGKTGVSAGALAAMLPMLLQAVQGAGASKGGVLEQIMAGMNAPGAGGAGGLMGQISGMLDQDGDGNPLDDIMGMFGKK